MAVKTQEHIWVKHVITPVSVLDDGSGHPMVFVDPDKQRACEANAVYGCHSCGEALVDAYGTTCEGAPASPDEPPR